MPKVDDRIRAAAAKILPFRLTPGQRQAIKEIVDDMQRPQPMHRLLQGDVGSGKTVVALFAMLLAAENDYQAAIMAPTELLAEQHHRSLATLFGPEGPRHALLTSSVTGAARQEIVARLAAGDLDVVVGTHALVEEGVAFKRLALAVGQRCGEPPPPADAAHDDSDDLPYVPVGGAGSDEPRPDPVKITGSPGSSIAAADCIPAGVYAVKVDLSGAKLSRCTKSAPTTISPKPSATHSSPNPPLFNAIGGAE